MKTVLLAVVVSLAGAVSAAALDIPVVVTEPAGIARTAEPVSGGIPLPAGQFKAGDGANFALFDEAGKPVPVQATELVVGAKGDLRWLLLDFQADLGANQTRIFTLRSGVKPAAPGKPLKVNREESGVTVDTGTAAFSLAADKPFSLLTAASGGGQQVLSGGRVAYTDGFTGKEYVAGNPSSVEVEYRGPMRTTICAKGGFEGDEANRLGYVARITAWAGRSDLHVKYSLSNSNPNHYSYRLIKESRIELKLAGQATEALVGTPTPTVADAPVRMNQTSRTVSSVIHGNDSLGTAPWLRRVADSGATATAAGKEIWASKGRGNVAQGWIAAGTKQQALCVDDLYFTEDPPRELAFQDGRLVLVGVAEPLEGAALPFAEKQRWLFDCSHLSSQYAIDLAATRDADSLSAEARRHRARVWAHAQPDWYFQTAALPVARYGSQADEIACYKLWDWKFDPKDVPSRPSGQFSSVPRWTAADDNHFTSEQDTLEALLLMFTRTGQLGFFEAAESWANYFMDLQTWRTDGWVWKDGGVWKLKQGGKGPLGNSPQRPADPVTGQRENLYGAWKDAKPFTPASRRDLFVLANAKACSCHNWGEGLVEWFMLTGDRDAYEAAIDTVEQNYDTQVRAFGKKPGKAAGYSRDFTRSCYLTHATRLIAPNDKLVVEASDTLAHVYLDRPDPEPRGFLNGPASTSMDEIRNLTTEAGVKAMKEAGVELDEKTGELVDTKSGARWKPVANPHTWMFPPLSRAMEIYYDITGNEDARDWLIAYGQAVARVLYQPRHSNLSYGRFLVDFPRKGVALDWASWQLPADSTQGEGVSINSYLGTFYPDVPARGYELSGIPLLKERAKDYWWGASHRGYNATKMHSLGKVGTWANVFSTHGETVCYTGKTFWIWSHPRTDTEAPAAVKDLAVTLNGKTATVTFTAPADAGGNVAEVQLKCSDKPIVDYEAFLGKFAANEDATVTNWWMAGNVTGEPGTVQAGRKVSFNVELPEGAAAKYFAVCTFDNSSNRSGISNVAEAK